MDALRYLVILLGCVVLTLPLEPRARVYRRPLRLAAAVLPVAAAFAAWDVVATARGHWWFADRFTMGPRILGLPVEEWMFFLVVPICALLTYETLSRGRAR
ncbi:MAG TPA: lycopene cyclase domain-containing protein [Actinophytocola sp.]|uniref:lycopene cyclase domain-containing protein n=1 Tax=Actinophytocola sp. TaxID=1872138 RepID=UPI002F921F99